MANIGPSFIGIGAQRAGTSWLFHCLLDHPEIFLPKKEVHFFDDQLDQGIDWYNSLFEPKGDARAWGELTPDYMYHAGCIERIHQEYPAVKLIILLREPISRAISAYNLYRSHGDYENMEFHEAVAQDYFILEQSLYAKQIKQIYELFPKEQVYVGFYEDIDANPERLLQEVYKFLCVDDSFVSPTIGMKKNVSAFSTQQRTLNLPKIQNYLVNSPLKNVYGKFKQTKLFNQMKSYLIEREKRNAKTVHCPPQYLELIARDMEELEGLLNVSLEHWRVAQQKYAQ